MKFVSTFIKDIFFKEPTALLQFSGGPCAVLAPLQAFLIRRCLENKISDLSTLSPATVTRILVEAMCDILKQSSKDGNFVVARVSQEVAQIIQVGNYIIVGDDQIG